MYVITKDPTKVAQLKEVIGNLPLIEKALPLLTPAERKEVLDTLEEALMGDDWPLLYINNERLIPYSPHHGNEESALTSDTPRYVLAKGSEGSGKSVFGLVKDFERIRRSMSGLMASPNLPHLQRSLWKEFQNWCPWDYVIPSHRRMADRSWVPVKPTDIVFENGSYIHAVGAKDIRSLEGPNLSWAHFDEARLFPDGNAIKVIDGRIRIPGPNGEPPQLWMTTTPRMNWLYEFFGPLKCTCPIHEKVDVPIQEGAPLSCPKCGGPVEVSDKYAAFKKDSRVITLHVKDNADNLSKSFVQDRAKSLTKNEAAVLIDALWIDDESDESFLPSITLWDNCHRDIPSLDPHTPIVIGMDASELHDSFSIIAVSRAPWDYDQSIAVRYVGMWDPGGQLLDYGRAEGPEQALLRLHDQYDVITVVFDPYQLHDFSQRIGREYGIWFQRFNQGVKRNESDRQLYDLIVERRLGHSGDRILRAHIANANRRRTSTSGKGFRMVKRSESLPIDCAVGLSMAAHECLRLNL